MNPKADFFFNKPEKWQEAYKALRTIVLDSPLTEEVKWGCPCYTFDSHNVLLIHGFKKYCALLFMKGALLSDPNGILIQQTENVQGARQIRFTSVSEIVELEPAVKAYVRQAIEVDKAGLKVDYTKNTQLTFPEEFQKALDNDPALKTAFEALTPGRQRAYNLYFTAPKQSKTREARVEKSIPKILAGKGLDDE
jgi:uncharacterized protein YdeI (YjbR/CyaY-like superfamily)